MDLGLFVASTGPPLFEVTLSLELILHYISDIVIGTEPWLNTTIACEFPRPWKQPKERPPPEEYPNDKMLQPASFYTGEFEHPGFGRVIVTGSPEEHDAPLLLHMDLHLDMLLYYNKTDDIFYGKFIDLYWFVNDRVQVTFDRSDGSSTADILYLPLSGPFDTSSSFIFARGEAKKQNPWTPPSMQKEESCPNPPVSPSSSSIIGASVLYVGILVPLVLCSLI